MKRHHLTNKVLDSFEELPQEEAVQMLAAYCDEAGCGILEAYELLSGATIVILPHYITSGPGYAGPVWLALFDSEPGSRLTFIANSATETMMVYPSTIKSHYDKTS